MNVLIDHHHGALLRSMYYLFNKRFGYNTFIPTGFEWLDQGGLYSSYPNRDTADQMLHSWKHSFKNNEFIPISFDEFVEMDIDIIVCTLLENYKIFEGLVFKYNKSCKLILHIGNNNPHWLLEQMGVKNLMSSSWPVYKLSNIKNKVFCRQEFSLEYFKPKLDCNIKSIANFKHIMDSEETAKFLELEKHLVGWECKCFGALNRDGSVPMDERIMSEKIRNFGFIFHFKRNDEGYGHVIHNAFACGKPVVTDSSYMGVYDNGIFIGNTPSLLFDQNKTIMDLHNNNISNIAVILNDMAENYETYSNFVYNKFMEVVNFDLEFLEIKRFIDELI